MSVVEIKGVTKSFGETTALQSIDLAIEEREFISLIGRRAWTEVTGTPEVVLLGGRVLVENGGLVAGPGIGQFVARAKFGQELKPERAVSAV